MSFWYAITTEPPAESLLELQLVITSVDARANPRSFNFFFI
jgi:hypothetical protein